MTLSLAGFGVLLLIYGWWRGGFVTVLVCAIGGAVVGGLFITAGEGGYRLVGWGAQLLNAVGGAG